MNQEVNYKVVKAFAGKTVIRIHERLECEVLQ